ncbi:MAG: FAD-dependent oxidoreductase, partial [Candidatus Woesearchaeota archaeon]|nr:FAD-dependent oxidoreductase [Candidatus Woesearchaeota archaeon]
LAKEVHAAKNAEKLGVKLAGKVNLKVVADTIKKRQDVIREHESPEYFRKKGIAVEMGSPRFTGKNSIEVNGKEFSAKKIVIATGSRPFTPPIEGVDDVDYFTNETIFKNTDLPKNFLVVGGGPIGIEIAHAYTRLGAGVTVVERNTHVLPKEDQEMGHMVCEVLKQDGAKLMIGYNPVRFEGKNTLIVSKFDPETRKNVGSEVKIQFDKVLIAIGRRLNIEGLALEKAGVKVEDKKIVVDKYLRTTNKRVFVCGDVAGDFMFTHWAEYQASIVINNMLNVFKKSTDRKRVAWVTYTDPELASFGMQESVLKEEGVKYRVIEQEIGDVDRAIAEGYTKGKLKLFISKGNIVGGTMLAKNAGELMGELVQAMTLKIPASKIFERIFPYPTMSRVNKKVIAKMLGEKLTTRAMGFLRLFFRLKR